MAAAGGAGPGGKIRTRRYHLTGRTPYTKSRQPQQQQGIIRRVTDTVRSIVPGWLQKYFNKDEAPAGATQESEPEAEHTASGENDLHHHLYREDEEPLPIDGRATPESVLRLAEEEPSTSRSALNFPDLLTRPSLHRSHLNFKMLDSPVHCQPTTSSAFPIGSAGFSLVKEIKDSTSQHDDDNISTTSGFSSRASDKDVAVIKSVPLLWSPEVDRSLTPSHNTSMDFKKPSFNLSAFGALSPTLRNTSVLKCGQLGDSPFYPGKTAYGGAAGARGRASKVRGTPYQAPLRIQVKAKPANVKSYGVTSLAARRIMDALEKMSSPLADAKKIPSSLYLTPERSLLDVSEMPPKRKRVDSPYPPVQKLVTPQAMSVSRNWSLYIKPSLTPSSTVNTSRRVEAKHNEARKNHVPEVEVEPPLKRFSYPKFSTPASNGLSSGGGGGKIMRERGSHYVTQPADEFVAEMFVDSAANAASGDLASSSLRRASVTSRASHSTPLEAEVPVLPEISLPLSTSALPSFNFTSSLPSSPPITVIKPADTKTQETTLINSRSEFKFSSPIVKSTESNAQSPGSFVGFTFSVPAVKASSQSTVVDGKMSAGISPAKSPIAVNNSSAKKKEEELGGFCKPATALKEGSVLDILRGPGFSSPPASPQTTSQTVTKSTAPLTKPAEGTFSLGRVGFGEGNKQALGLWQCNTCLVENKASNSKCTACSAAKDLPTTVAPKQPTASTPSTKSTPPFTGALRFGDKFKVASGTWDCDTCLVQNKPEVTKCVACETPKPGTGVKPAMLLAQTTKAVNSVATPISSLLAPTVLGFGDIFKRPHGSWDCTVCFVQNKAEDGKCVACMSEKPGTSAPVTIPTSGLAAPPSSGQLGLLDQFKKPGGSWDCDVCAVQNKAESTKCVCCDNAKPGAKLELKGFGAHSLSTGSTAPSFKFGVQSSVGTGEVKFGLSTDSASSMKNTPAGGFSFPKPTGEFTFGVSAKATEEKNEKGFGFATAAATNNQSSAGFQFGTASPAQTEKDNLSKPLPGGFSFGTVSNAVSPAPAADSSGGAGFQFNTTKDKLSNPTASFGLKEPEEKRPEPLRGFAFDKMKPQKEAVPTHYLFGEKGEKSSDCSTAGPSLLFGMKPKGEETKQLSFAMTEQSKEDNPAPATFAFSVVKPAGKKEADQAPKPVFAFGSQTNTTDTGASKQTFGFLSSSSSIAVPASSSEISNSVFGSTASLSTPASSGNVFGSTAPVSTSANPSGVFGSTVPVSTSANTSSMFGSTAPVSTSANSSSVFGSTAPVSTSANSSSMFGNSAAASNLPPTGTFMFAQPSSTVSSGSVFGSAPEAKSSFVFNTQESKAVTSSSTATASPFMFGGGAASTNTNTTAPGFNFGATNTSNATGTNSSPFIFGQIPTAPSGLTIGANPVPAFGQSTGQPSAPAFGSTSTSMFPAGSTPVFGSVTSSIQPPVFGQQSTQPAFGPSAPPNTGPGFPFGSNTSFNFASGSSSAVFTFGSNAGGVSAQPAPAPAPTPTPSFMFNQTPAFNMGANGRNAPASTVSKRKIKTAVRRRK